MASGFVSSTSRVAAARKDFPAGSKTWIEPAPAKGNTFRHTMLDPMTYSGQSWYRSGLLLKRSSSGDSKKCPFIHVRKVPCSLMRWSRQPSISHRIASRSSQRVSTARRKGWLSGNERRAMVFARCRTLSHLAKWKCAVARVEKSFLIFDCISKLSGNDSAMTDAALA